MIRPRLLALRALGLGDFLTAVPALRALGAAFPGHHRTLAAPAALRPLVALLGTVDDLVDTDFRDRFTRLPPPPRRPDVAVNLHGCGPQSHGALLADRPVKLLAYRHPAVAASRGGPEWVGDEHEVDRWCRLLAAYGIAADPRALVLHVPTGDRPGGATVVHPGAASPSRRWPAERWAAVARAEAAAGHDVVVTGSAGEAELAAEVARRAGLPNRAVLAGRMDLGWLAATIAAAGRVVCGDTGVAHLATATRTPSVVLFGPTSPARWGPRIDRDRHRVLWSGRTGDPHAADPDPGLLEITPADVLAEIARLPSTQPA